MYFKNAKIVSTEHAFHKRLFLEAWYWSLGHYTVTVTTQQIFRDNIVDFKNAKIDRNTEHTFHKKLFLEAWYSTGTKAR